MTQRPTEFRVAGRANGERFAVEEELEIFGEAAADSMRSAARRSDGFADDGVEIAVEAGVDGPKARNVLVVDESGELHLVVGAVEKATAGEKFPNDDAKPANVRRRADFECARRRAARERRNAMCRESRRRD